MDCASQTKPKMKVSVIICIFFVSLLTSGTVLASEREEQPRLNFSEIQSGVMSLADSWIALSGQGYTRILATENDPLRRLEIGRRRYHSMSSVVDIATGPWAGIATLDMMVFASLSRATWDRVWPSDYPESGKLLAQHHQQFEEDAWQFAASYLNDKQLAEIRNRIEVWLASHPEAHSANLIRFSDFGLGQSPDFQQETRPGGLFSPVRDAAAAAEAIQETSERALYLALRMQNMVADRAELTVASIMVRDDVSQLLTDVSGFRVIAEEYARLLDEMPDEVDRILQKNLAEIGREREATITQVMTELSRERQVAVVQLMEAISTERQAALEQVLVGVKTERNQMMDLVLALVTWTDLQAKATFARIFVLSVCLVLLFFLLRLVHRYTLTRENLNFKMAVSTIALFCVIVISIIAIGVFFIEFSKPDMQRIEALQAKLNTENP
jgi:hypothetical protein